MGETQTTINASRQVEKRTLASGVPVTGLELREGVRSHAVGRGLHQAEQEFIATLVRWALREAKGKKKLSIEAEVETTAAATTHEDETINRGLGDAPVLLSRL